jgi:hypothetical protein
MGAFQSVRLFGRSAPGQKQTSISEGSMSALPLKTDIHRHDGDVRFVPEPEVAHFLAVSFAKGTHERHLSTQRPALFAGPALFP